MKTLNPHNKLLPVLQLPGFDQIQNCMQLKVNNHLNLRSHWYFTSSVRTVKRRSIISEIKRLRYTCSNRKQSIFKELYTVRFLYSIYNAAFYL